MARDYWREQYLRDAARLLNDAADNLHTSYPHSNSSPNSATLPAVLAMIAAAEQCIKEAQPTPSTTSASQ